jgi:hypothetical protein
MKRSMNSLALLVTLLAGCAASYAPEWESTFGDAARQVRAAQVIDPAASTRNTELAPTDGKAVAGAQKAYAESYGYGPKEAKQPALSISTTGAR